MLWKATRRLECNYIELRIAPILVKVIQVGGGWELPAVGVGGSCRERVALVAAQQLSHSSVGWLLAGAGRHHLCRETGGCRESAFLPYFDLLLVLGLGKSDLTAAEVLTFTDILIHVALTQCSVNCSFKRSWYGWDQSRGEPES